MLTVHTLRCEYAENPLGLDVTVPRFSWQLTAARRGTAQSAYRLRVADSLAALAAGAGNVWDSGWVNAAQTLQVEYAGRELHSRERCYWSVAARDDHGHLAESTREAWFEMGLLEPRDWQTQWIGIPAAASGHGLLLRREFTVEKPVRSARLYAAGLGLYELRLNGTKVGDAVLEPAPTNTARRVLYTTHDISAALQPGKNTVGVMLGNGWCGAPKFLAQLEIRFTDDSQQCLFSGGPHESPMMWMAAPGPVLLNGIYDGEDYDARRERPGWDAPGGVPGEACWKPDGWMAAMIADAPGGRLVSATVAEPIRVVETLRPRSIAQPLPGRFVVDFGRNFAGWVRLRVSGPAGTRISLRFAECRRADGTVNQDNLRTARAADSYTLKGVGPETWEPRFTYHGFRYVEVEGWPGTPTPADLDGCVVRSAVAARGEFTCDQALLNDLQRAIVNTEASNLHGVPTDCPQRDERMGWLNDLTARSEEAIHNFDLSRFFTKFLEDIADAQDPVTGALPCTVPQRFGSLPTDPVCIGYLLLPWLLYQHYGDRRLLQKHYAGMRAWVDCLAARADADGVLRYSHYGDWAPPLVGEQARFGADAINHTTPGTLVSTAFLAYHAALLATIADTLGNSADVRAYQTLAETSRAAFNREFWDEAAGGYGQNNQSANALALYAGLVPAERVARVVDNLARNVAELNDFHLTSGNICSKYVLEALTAHGHAEAACRVAAQTTYPSWGFMLANGATTLWERWENVTGGGMNSHNHAMLGSVGAWFYRHLAGVQLAATAVGTDHVLIRPPLITGLNAAAATLETPRGTLACDWERGPQGLVLRLLIPVGCHARVELRPASGATAVSEADQPLHAVEGISDVVETPGVLCFTVTSGRYCFQMNRGSKTRRRAAT
jgi:alpha-L-rhamnosidase